MAWYSDEQYEMIRDSREKKSVAASAFKQKTHCGKGGAVKFPSDYLSKKELKAMNGECKSYRMNDPISWSEFVEWPNEHKVSYIKRIREKFGASDKYVAEMFDVACNLFLMYVKELGLDAKPECDEDWSRNKFYAWRSGAKTELVEETVEEPSNEPEEQKSYEWKAMKWAEFKLLSDEKKVEYIKWIRDTFNANDGVISEMLGMDRSWFGKMVIAKFNLGRGKGAGKGKWDKEGFEKWCNSHSAEKVAEEPMVINEPTEIIVPTAGPMVVVDADALFQKHVENIEAAESAFMEAMAAAQPETVLPVNEDKVTSKPACELAEDCDKRRIHEAGPIAFMGNPMPVIPKSGSMTFENNFADDALQVMKVLLSNARVKLNISWEVVKEDC